MEMKTLKGEKNLSKINMAPLLKRAYRRHSYVHVIINRAIIEGLKQNCVDLITLEKK